MMTKFVCGGYSCTVIGKLNVFSYLCQNVLLEIFMFLLRTSGSRRCL